MATSPDDIVRAVPRTHLDDAVRKVKPAAEPSTEDDALKTLRRVRDLLQTYRTILNSKAMLHVFEMAQIHGAPFRGEQVNTDEVDEAIAKADRILGTTGETVPQTTTAPDTEKP